MARDKRILFIITSSLVPLLLLSMLMSVSGGRYTAAFLLSLAASVSYLFLKKRAIPSIFKREVLVIVSVFSVLYLVLLYVMGISFGFARAPFQLDVLNFFKYFVPILLIILSSEIYRMVILAYSDRVASLLSYVALVFGEVLIYSTLYGIYSFNSFMDFVALYLVPAMVSGIAYQYFSRRYGIAPSIVYRTVTTLYFYVFTYVPNIPDSINAVIRLLSPMVIYAFVHMLYEKKEKRAIRRESRWGYVTSLAALVVMVAFAMLISCQFRFGAIIVATESMTGEINRGDAVVYERYDDQILSEGQVIIFKDGDTRIVHRVIKIERINGQNRYYTKGDMNEDPDPGYITDADVVGTAELKVPYVGYPTIWIREIVNGVIHD